MQQADKGSSAELEGAGLRVAIVRARFNDAVTQAIAQACIGELLRLDVESDDIRHVTVPGALEIPVVLKTLAESGDHDALVATSSKW
jgi:6,7-dimethyl-8-ribityllumazine synthase